MAESSKRIKKRLIVNKLYENLTNYRQCLVVKLENVTSNQVQQTRLALRQKKLGDMVCGKNTVIKKAIDIRLASPKEDDPDYEFRKRLYTKSPQIEKLLSLCKGKVGFIFSDAPIFDLKPIIEANRIPAPARVGTFAPLEVIIPAGPTGLDPSQITFFHTLSIATKIQKGQIEIIRDFRVCEKGKKIGNSEAAILSKLNIKPFSFGMEILYVYDNGAILGPEVFNLDPNALLDKMRSAAKNITAISLAIGQPNALSIPHMISGGFKNIISIALEANIKIKALEKLSAATTTTTTTTTSSAPAKKEEVKYVEKEGDRCCDHETNLGAGLLFGDDDDF